MILNFEARRNLRQASFISYDCKAYSGFPNLFRDFFR